MDFHVQDFVAQAAGDSRSTIVASGRIARLDSSEGPQEWVSFQVVIDVPIEQGRAKLRHAALNKVREMLLDQSVYYTHRPEED